MIKKIAILTILMMIIFSGLQSIGVTPQKVLLVGKLMGFEIANASNSSTSNLKEASFKKIGTVTFIKKDTSEFVALGHSTAKNKETKLIKGECYDINFENINKGQTGKTGNIVASLDKNSKIGDIHYDSAYGIFGKMNRITESYKEIETACWYSVKKGNANILAVLNNDELKSYEVEIEEIDYINKNKNIKIKVNDKELIAKTGGIVQGMSGTPLIQNGKLIGAVNYVSEDDPSIAYAIFIDKLL